MVLYFNVFTINQTKLSSFFNSRGILLWRDCHCRACMCDKAFAHCISAYKCPYDEKTLSAEKGVKNETRYLTQDECHTKAVNVSGYLPI